MGAVLLGLTVAQWIALIPQIWAALKVADEIYAKLTDAKNVPNEEAAAQAFGLLGKAVVKLASDAIGMTVPLPHKMTREEEELWFQHASGTPG